MEIEVIKNNFDAIYYYYYVTYPLYNKYFLNHLTVTRN